MIKQASWSGFEEDVPELAPIVATEKVEGGWRGLTADGEVYDVQHEGRMPEVVMISRAGRIIGKRKVRLSLASDEVNGIDIARYLEHFASAVKLHKDNRNVEALSYIDVALATADSSRARFNRAMILLALGRWPEGFADFETCERSPPFQRPAARTAIDAGAKPWRGEDVEDRRLLLVHDHGFGDTIMTLRFIKVLQSMGVDVVMHVPPELAPIAAQVGLVTANSLEIAAQACDFFTSFLHIMRWLAVTPSSVPTGSYLSVDAGRVARWRGALPPTSRRRVGLAWSVGQEDQNDFPRSLPLEELVRRFPDAELHSVQKQGADEARELGVVCHDFADLADCAACMLCMDQIVSVDTMATHLAGAIGHPCAIVLLSRWHSWRWNGNPFYPGIQIESSGR